ncbi:MAG: leucine-rich repeat domain-containing protein, partial [Bacteroidales bacterium]|nr:leucine-rich repeat domain-containing protein [Bacteroidales bacterium]
MSDDIAQYVGMITPFDEKNSTLSEVAAPTVSLKASMDEKYYDPQYKWVADLEVWNEGTKSFEYLDYDARNPYADSKYSCIPINYYEEKGRNADGINYKFFILEPNAVSVSAIKPNTKYRWSFYKFEETGYTAFIKEEEKKFISLMSTIAISAQVQNALNETQGLAGTFAGTEHNSGLSTDAKAQGESMSALMNEFAQSSASTDQELIDLAGQEDVLRRVNVLREEMKNGLGQYRIMCLQFETTTGEYLTVKDQINAYLTDDSESSATALSTKRTIKGLDNKEYTLKAKIGSDNNRTDIGRPMVMPIGYDGVMNTEPYQYNPYYVLNVWGAKAMRPLSTYDRSYCSNTMEVHYFNKNASLAYREKGTTLNITIGGTYKSSDASLWRNYPDDKVYNMGAYDHYGTDYEVINALFNPMMSNQWIPINGRFKDLSMQVTDLLSHDCSLVKKLQTSIKNKWKNMTANLGDWKDADNNWNNASYTFEREPERYAKLTTGQDDTYREKVSTTKYYTNDKVGEIYYPHYQLPLINILRWNSLYNRTSGKPVDHWPAHVNDNCELVTTTKEEVVYAADIMSNKSDRNKGHDFKGDDYKTIVDKLQFLVMRPNAYNAADFSAGDIADVNNIADIVAGKPKVMHRVMVRPSTEPEYIFNLSVKPGERRQTSNPSGNYWTTTASEIDGFSESDLVWIASPCLRKYLAKKLNAALNTSYTTDSKFATSHLSTVTEIISTDNWTEDAKTAFEGADLLANLKKIDVKFAKFYSGITLDLRKCKKLEYVKIQNLDAEKVILSGLDKLTYLNITAVAPDKEGSRSGTYGAGISYIDLSGCKELTQLYLSNHQLTGVEGLSDLTKLVRLNLCGNKIASLDVTVLPNLNGRYTYLGGQFYHRAPYASDAGTWVSDFWYLNQSKGCRQFLSLRASRQFEDDYGREAMTPEEMRAFASSYQTLGSQYYKGMFDGLYYPQDAEKYGA